MYGVGLWCHAFLLPLRGRQSFVVVSLVDPFFVDCIVLDKDTTHYSTNKFHNIHSIQRCFWPFYVCHLYYVEYSCRGGCYDQSVFDRIFNVFFFQSKLHIYCIRFFLSSDQKKNYIFHIGEDIKLLCCIMVLCCPTPAALSV